MQEDVVGPDGSGFSEGLGAGAGARSRMRGAISGFALWILALLAIAAWVMWIAWASHKDEPKLRAECEARGGMLIGTRTELYACVGKPPALPASR